jgi:exodeoxyribonuclease VII large subunit
VARAIARSRIPVISGVGHETDFTIADFVADYRASTPTAAATSAVPAITELQADLEEKQQVLTAILDEKLERLGERLERATYDLQRASPKSVLNQRRQQLDDLTETLRARMVYLLSLRTERLRGQALRLHSLSPLLTIARGYAVVRRDSDQAVITSPRQVQPGEQLTIQVRDGSIPVEVLRSHNDNLSGE